MSALAAIEERLPLDDERILVARQPVVDARMRVKAYRIAYGLLEDGIPCTPSGADAVKLFNEVFNVTNLEMLVGDSVAHVHVSRDLLTMVDTSEFWRERVTLGVRYGDVISETLGPSLDRAFRRRSALDLDTLPGPDFNAKLLDQFGIVEIDFARWPTDRIAKAMREISGRRCIAHATNVQTIGHRERAKDLGFGLLSGSFLTKAAIVEDRTVPVQALNGLVNVARLQSDTITLEELIKVVQRDPELSARLLKHINSAHFGFAAPIRSVRNAAVLLGCREVARWAMLHAALGAAPKMPAAQLMITMTRAGMCERLAEVIPGVTTDALFTAGVLSMADVLVGVRLSSIMSELAAEPDVKQAVLTQSGPVGQVLAGVIAYERGEFDAPALAPIIHHCGVAYRQALSWAQRAVTSIR